MQDLRNLKGFCFGLFSGDQANIEEEKKIDEIAGKIIFITHLLDQRKYIPYGPAYSKLPKFLNR
jgi:hypothetical protein